MIPAASSLYRRRRKLVFLAVAAVALAVGAGAAYGYFNSTGSGQGSAQAGTMQTVTVAAIAGQTPNTLLQPGSTGEVILEVDNPNGFPAHLVSVMSSGAITVSGGSGCTTANSGVTFTDQTGLSVPLAASGSTLVRLAGAAAMSSSSASGCQGATFSIPVTITVEAP